jgi:serine/threonine protein kinase
LKPENLLLSDQGESSVLKIADFGLSAVVFATETSSLSSSTFSSPNGIEQYQHHSRSEIKTMGSPSSPNNKATLSQSPNFQDPYQQSPHTPLSHPKEMSPSNTNVSHMNKIYSQQSNDPPPNTPALRRLKSVVGSPHYVAPEIMNAGKFYY